MSTLTKQAERTTGDTEGAQSIQRAFRVLRFVSGRFSEFPTAAEVAAACDLTKPTAHRILAALTSERFLRTVDAGKLHTLGPESYFLGVAASRHYTLSHFAAPSIERIAAITGDTCFLTVRSGDESICVGRSSGDFPIKILTLNVGDRRPLGVGAGSLALLAFLPEAEREDVLTRLTPRLRDYPSFTTEIIAEEVTESRRQGHAYNGGRLIPEMCAVGYPVYGAQGALIGSLSVAAIAQRLNPIKRAEIVDIMRIEAEKIQRAVREGASSSNDTTPTSTDL